MRKICNKFIAIVLTIAMLSGFAVTAGATTTSELTVTSIAAGIPVPTGKIVAVDVANVPSDASKVVIKNGDATVASADATNGATSINVTVVDGITKYVVEAQNDNGDAVASGTITIRGAAVEVISTKYDNIDFEDSYGLNVSAPSYTLTKNGASMGAYLHAGNATNEIKIEENPQNNEMGKSLHFIANDATAKVQANEMGAIFSSGTVVYELDFCAQNLNMYYSALSGAFYPIGASSYQWTPVLSTTTNGDFTVSGEVVGKCEPNVWYHLSQYVDLASDYCYTYIDNKLVHFAKLSFDAEKSHKLSVSTSTTTEPDVTPCGFYIDNVSAYNANVIDPIPAISIESYAANSCIPEGAKAKITVSANFIPAGSVVNLVDVKTGNQVASADYAEGMCFECALPQGVFSYKAVVKDSDGEVIAQSDAIELIGYDETVLSTIWNENFEGATATTSGVSVSFSRNGSALKSSTGAGVAGHTGAAGNSITIGTATDVESGINGDCIILKNNDDSAKCQLNNFGINSNGAIVDVSVDFATDSYGLKQAFAIVDGNGGWRFPPIYTNASGEFTYKGTPVGKYVTNKWYNLRFVVDTTNGVLNTYIDNLHVMSEQSSSYKLSTIGSVGRLSVTDEKVKGATYIDNFKVFNVQYTRPTPAVTVDYNDYDHALVAGTKISVNAKTAYIDNVASLKLVQIYENATIGEVKSSTDARFEIELKPWPMQYKVQALDAEGVVIVESDPFTAYGKNLGTTAQIWDEDFEGVTANNNSLPNVGFAKDGSVLKASNGSTLNGHIGAADNGNSITVGAITTVDNGNNGKGIMVNSVTPECQLNNFGINSGADIVDVSIDFATDTYGEKQAFALVHNGWVYNSIYTDENGNFAYGSIKIGKYVTNKWYNLRFVADTVNGIVDVYIDNVHVLREQKDSYKKASAGKIVRLAISNKRTVGTIYVDNFKVSERSVSAFEYKLAEAKLVINGSFTESVVDGDLVVSTVTTCNGSESFADIIVAVYEGNELVCLKTAPVAFTEGGAVAIGNKIEVGNVSAGQKIKVMLWDGMTSVIPVCKPIDFE
ncbi:MAG: hypothetical protein II998_09625 [Clostridia bacterium]|nr:hypothetical protein [Clostridia bacterium]